MKIKREKIQSYLFAYPDDNDFAFVCAEGTYLTKGNS